MPPVIVNAAVTVMVPPPPVKPAVFARLRLLAVMVEEALELAVKLCVPDSCMAPETEISPVVAPPANEPPESDVETALSRPLPWVYVPLVMFNAAPTVTLPAPAVKLPPLKVRSPEVATVNVPVNVVVPPVIVMEAIEAEPPLMLVSIATFAPMFTVAPAAAAVTPGMQPAHVPPVQVQRAAVFQRLRPPLE